MRVGLHQRAEAGTTYAPDAWAGNIGKEIPINIGTLATRGKLVDAVVAEDGLSVSLTIEIDGSQLGVTPEPSGFTWSEETP